MTETEICEQNRQATHVPAIKLKGIQGSACVADERFEQNAIHPVVCAEIDRQSQRLAYVGGVSVLLAHLKIMQFIVRTEFIQAIIFILKWDMWRLILHPKLVV